MALRARLVGGRGSWSPGGGEVRERTVAEDVVARCCFERGAEEEEEAEGSVLVESSGMMIDAPSGSSADKRTFCLFQTLTLFVCFNHVIPVPSDLISPGIAGA